MYTSKRQTISIHRSKESNLASVCLIRWKGFDYYLQSRWTYHNFNSFSKHLHRDHQSTTTFMNNVSFQANDTVHHIHLREGHIMRKHQTLFQPHHLKLPLPVAMLPLLWHKCILRQIKLQWM